MDACTRRGQHSRVNDVGGSMFVGWVHLSRGVGYAGGRTCRHARDLVDATCRERAKSLSRICPATRALRCVKWPPSPARSSGVCLLHASCFIRGCTRALVCVIVLVETFCLQG